MKNVLVFLLIMILITVLAMACSAPAQERPTDPSEEGTTQIPEEKPGEEKPEQPMMVFPGEEEILGRFSIAQAFPGVSFERPLDLQNAGDGSGRLFVVEQAGRIFVLSGPGATEKELFLDIREIVTDSGNEMGLLGLAFHPDFARNGYFFVNFTGNNETVVARYKASGNQGDPGSQHIILRFPQPYSNHNGGQLAFGPDGLLYMATGDGGGSGDPQGNGQNRETYHGNILRIDVDSREPGRNYAIPEDNPFAGNESGYLEEIYAYGLRNPWRFSFDSLTGQLWAADVGQNAVEEINLITSGQNYGWNIMEGSLCYNPPTDCDPTGLEGPVYQYLHPLGRSITGGYVYRGEEFPLLAGAYVYGDFISGLIWGLWYQDGQEPVNHLLVETELMISSFGVDETGELYLTAFDGSVYHLQMR